MVVIGCGGTDRLMRVVTLNYDRNLNGNLGLENIIWND